MTQIETCGHESKLKISVYLNHLIVQLNINIEQNYMESEHFYK